MVPVADSEKKPSGTQGIRKIDVDNIRLYKNAL